MKILRLNSEDLEKMPVENFRNMLVYNHCKSGIGKTRKIHKIINYCIKNGLKIMICMVNHNLITEFLSYKQYDCVHLMGKPFLCVKEGLEAYIPGCKKCDNIRSCLYIKQLEKAKKKSIIFIVPQHLFMVEKYKPDVLVIDESVENIVFGCIETPDYLEDHLEFRQIECKECIKINCTRRGKGWKFGFCYAKLVKKPIINHFTPNTLDGHFFKDTVEKLDNIYAIQDEGKWKIGGIKNMEFLKDIPTIVFNCATTDINLAEKMFNREIDLLLEDKKKLENKIYCLDETMTITKTSNFIDKLLNFFDLFNIPKGNETLIFCKERFEEDIKSILQNVQVDHYGVSRGTNQYEGVRHVVLVGRYWLREDHRTLLKMQGLTDDEIDRIAISEEEQAFHRARPLLYNDVMVYLLTDTLVKYEVVEATVKFKRSHLRIMKEIIERKDELVGMNRSEIYNAVKGNHKDIATALYILEDLGYIYPLEKYGDKLTWSKGGKN